MTEKRVDSDNCTILYDDRIITEPTVSLFSTEGKRGLDSSNAGRGTVFFFEQDNKSWVLKRYLRGGFIAKFNQASYLYSGLDNTRMVREFRLLQHMIAADLPVPRPVATLIVRNGLMYQGSMITERLAAKNTLAELISKKNLETEQWQAIGQCVARFHNHSIYHADLNANNIMLDDTGVSLIDFDKCAEKPDQSNGWPMQNLARLNRSLLKIQRQQPELHFNESDWQTLLAGYQENRS